MYTHFPSSKAFKTDYYFISMYLDRWESIESEKRQSSTYIVRNGKQSKRKSRYNYRGNERVEEKDRRLDTCWPSRKGPCKPHHWGEGETLRGCLELGKRELFWRASVLAALHCKRWGGGDTSIKAQLLWWCLKWWGRQDAASCISAAWSCCFTPSHLQASSAA